jgi:hypothetical protein
MPVGLICLRIDLLACFGVSGAETSGAASVYLHCVH